ncbi:MAG: Asp-tRNA(Asn)/Glu-tRNA(Gln) amidotransferase subunit GatB [Candidatus Portnoybacteria bacterium]|nr:Asp-tRNA(Asn)/Glu-tRNA(Gln) amidotransferase subunit GatB [Candidatus Portnoybacteria bacterium]
MRHQPVIGLEIHAELKTESKMFCDCLNDPEAKEPNLNICPICLGHPGSLPVINQKAIEFVIKTGLALNCRIPPSAKFDRKNYFYPDLPKNYQISQYGLPLSLEGFLETEGEKIRIREIHLEEDTGKLVHPAGADYSLVDFNRAGVPLMELITEPDIRSGQEARQFGEELQLILRYLGVSEANMEKGQMRCEVNISLKSDKKELGTKVEIKNLNSFRAVERSIDYEIKRQGDLLESGQKVVQETRGWDENKQKTFSQRTKEEAQDYRYFPEPDLPPLTELTSISQRLSTELPELPQAKRQRFSQEYKLPPADIDTLVVSKGLADYFEQIVSELETWLKIKSISDKQPLIKLTANYLLTELQKLLLVSKTKIEDCQISPENFAEFITLIQQKEISSSAAQKVLQEMFQTGIDPSHIVEDKKLRQVSDEAELTKIVNRVIKKNPQPVKDYQSGKENALQFLVGQVMAASQGQANPQVVGEILKKKISQ